MGLALALALNPLRVPEIFDTGTGRDRHNCDSLMKAQAERSCYQSNSSIIAAGGSSRIISSSSSSSSKGEKGATCPLVSSPERFLIKGSELCWYTYFVSDMDIAVVV